ncbi:dynamin-like protein [Cryptosporidium ubiquitum]|uniref:Dynactin subunit 4 n=1 Tax=Cryptosporidium ubiquitum TaxID=857276 RepID=A0A1J4MFV2_9CRYT|nr:dynamin-like protein [Cryptosporidium ubiquitum]OII71717.1 dynamin-like protein [Cryptosporidium ubiquitum]
MHNSNVFYFINGEHHDLINCYYCESCNKLISQEEVKIEIDTYFCPNCLENIPSSEAFSRNFRCINCHDCPRCMATISTNKLNLGIESNENNGGIVQFSYNCGFCYFSLNADYGMNIVSEVNETTNKEPSNGSKKLGAVKYKNSFSLQESNYLSLIFEKMSNSMAKHFDPYIINDTTKSKNLDDEQEKLNPALRILEEKQQILTSLLKEKNLWQNNDKLKCLSNIKNSFPNSPEKNNLSYRQYLNHPEIINSVYLSLRSNSNNGAILYPFEKKLCVQISKRCTACKRLVIKPQLNPLSQPPFRVNLSANLFLPNFRIVSIKNASPDNRSFERVIKIKIENLMDRQVRVDFLPEKDQNEQLSIENSKIYSIFRIEPKSLNIEPKWDPLLEQQDQQSNILASEKRGEFGTRINCFYKFPIPYWE